MPFTSLAHLDITVTSPERLSPFAGRSTDWLWSADLVARRGAHTQRFAGVLFVESAGVAFLCGVETETGYPTELARELAVPQQAVIAFLREETAKEQALLPTRRVFTGWEYACEWKATAGYIAARANNPEQPRSVGVGYRTERGDYERLALPLDEVDTRGPLH